MSQRRKIIVILAVLLLLGGTVAITLLVPGAGRADGYRTACESLITAIAKKDFNASYNLLSAGARRADTQQSWKNKTAVLGNIYEYADVKLVNRADVKANTETNQPAQVQLSYTVAGPAATSNVSCVAMQQNDKYVVDGFSSQVGKEATQ